MKLLTLVTTALILYPAEAFAQDEKEQDAQNMILNTKQQMRVTEKYWTKERLESAIPMPSPSLSEEEFQKLLARYKAEAIMYKSEKTTSIPSADPKGFVAGVPTRANTNGRPYWNGGKLFFTKADGKDYACTAEFTGQNDILLTAAHCVRDGKTGAWYSNFVFYRAYNNGGGQKVGWKCAAAYYMWANPPLNLKYDYAFIHTNTKSGAGWLGLMTGIPFSSWTAIGYPINFGNGQYMYEVVGQKGTISNGVVQMKDNPMRQGSSGGAWIGDVTKPHVGGNWAIGLNSFFVNAKPNSMYGPLFTSDTMTLFGKAQRCAE